MNRIMKMSVAVLAAMTTCALLAKSSSNDDDDEEDYGSNVMVFSMDTDGFPDTVGNNYYILTEYLPEGVPVVVSNNKMKTPKSSTPKVKKVDGEREVVVKEKGEDNPSGLKLKYSRKTGKVTGSFKVYASYENKKGKLKLKKYSAKVSGTIGEEGLKVTISRIGTFLASLE